MVGNFRIGKNPYPAAEVTGSRKKQELDKLLFARPNLIPAGSDYFS
jgi:hypothetical protein